MLRYFSRFRHAAAFSAMLLGAPMLTSASDIVPDDLITGSSQTTPWLVCDQDTPTSVATLDAGGCAYRATPAEPGITYRMSGASVLALVTACSNGGSGGASVGGDSDTDNNTTVETLGTRTILSNDFDFPQVTEVADGFQVTIPEGPLPDFPARRVLSAGTGNAITFGDPVVLKYSMYSWATGALVESSDDFDEAVTIVAGATDGVPEYLSSSVLGRNVGDRLEIIFEAGMADLPDYLDNTDAYVVVLDLM